MKTKLLLISLAVLLSGLVFAQQGKNPQHPGHNMPKTTSAAEPEAEVTSSAKEVAVSMKDFKYSPALLKVKVGTKVTWTNKEGVPHTITADKGEFDSGTLSQDQTFSHTFGKAGTYKYHCNFHGSAGSGMAGTVRVTKK